VIGARGIVNEPRPKKKIVRVTKRLFPGYVFLESEEEPAWEVLAKNVNILKPLGYDDCNKALRGPDLEFVSFLKFNKGFLGISKAIQVGARIQIIDGPLKDYEGRIVKLNRRRYAAEVVIDGAGIVPMVWLPYEVIGQRRV